MVIKLRWPAAEVYNAIGMEDAGGAAVFDYKITVVEFLV